MPDHQKPARKLQPRKSVKHTDMASVTPAFEAPAHHYHLVELDAFGNEIPGSDFGIGERQYERSFKGNPKFTVKKNPKK